VSGQRRRGPGRLSPEELTRFLGQPRWASLCIEDDTGRLQAGPVWIEQADEDELLLRSPAHVILEWAGPDACVVTDEFESYAGIKGAIVRGALQPVDREAIEDTPARRLRISRSLGFTFRGARTSL
jgi:hypothetical protein